MPQLFVVVITTTNINNMFLLLLLKYSVSNINTHKHINIYEIAIKKKKYLKKIIYFYCLSGSGCYVKK